jgi:hypothetical protein
MIKSKLDSVIDDIIDEISNLETVKEANNLSDENCTPTISSNIGSILRSLADAIKTANAQPEITYEDIREAVDINATKTP